MKKLNLAIVGASGLVGNTVLDVLREENLLQSLNLTLYVSDKSAGKVVMNGGLAERLVLLDEKAKSEHFDIVIMSAGDDISRKYAPYFAKNGAFVIDNTNAFRRDKSVPLVVPEINIEKINKNTKIISNPNCSTIELAVVLDRLCKLSKIKKVIVSTYQSVSGAGSDALLDLKYGTNKVISEGIRNNVVAHIGDFMPYGFCTEEDKMMFEMNKILEKEISLVASTVRVPVKNCHGESVYVCFEDEVDAKKAENALQCDYIKTSADKIYTLSECMGTNQTYVCRMRNFSKTELAFFVIADNLRRGAAYNAVMIAKFVMENFFKQ